MAGQTDPALLARRLEDMARRAAQRWQHAYTGFLDPAGWTQAQEAARREGAGLSLYVSWPDAERRMACFYPRDGEAPEDFPVTLLCIHWNAKFASLGHRDLLGSLMGLGLQREALGDILMEEGRAYCPVTEAVAGYIAANLTQAGRTRVQVETASQPPQEAAAPMTQEVAATVAALRLDAVVAAGYRLARSAAQESIAAGLVKVNHLPCLKGDALLREGDLISVRGRGRLRLRQVGYRSQKGRIHILLDRTK